MEEDIPLRFDLVRRIANQLNKNSSSQNLLFYKMVLMHRQHGLDIVLGVTEDHSVTFLTSWLSSNRLDLHALHDRLLDTARPVFEYVSERARIDARERLSGGLAHDDDRLQRMEVVV